MLDDLFFTGAFAVLLFHACFWGLRTIQITRALVRVPQILPDDERTLPEDAPLISVLVPAHNEQSEIRECVESVLRQDYPRFELILVDDRSEDLTASIARDLAKGQDNFRVISIHKLPTGWTGKCHALDTGCGMLAENGWHFLTRTAVSTRAPSVPATMRRYVVE